MTFLKLILLCVVLALVFWGIGSFIGNRIGKAQKKRDEALKNGSKHI